MDFESSFVSLDPEQKARASAWMRKEFAPILTRWEPVEGGGRSVLQLQLIDRKAHALLHYRLDFCSFSSDRLVLGHHLVLHRVQFIRKGVTSQKEQVGDYVELCLGFSDLWEVGRRLNVPRGDVQVLLMDQGVRKVLDVEALRPFLPERLKQVNLIEISQRGASPPVETPGPKTDEPKGRGGALDLLT